MGGLINRANKTHNIMHFSLIFFFYKVKSLHEKNVGLKKWVTSPKMLKTTDGMDNISSYGLKVKTMS